MQHLQKKTGGVGVLWSFLVAPPYRYVAPTYLLCLPLLGKLPGVYPTFPFWKGCTPNVQTFILQTFKRSSRPIAAERPWCHNWQRHENFSRSGETSPLPSVSKLRERTSGTVAHRSRSQTPIRSELQVVPRPNVLMLDRSAGWLALQRRAGKAGSVRLG